MSAISSEEFIEHVGRESSRFLDVLRAVPGSVRVPSCPDWDADDLLFHLAEVQHFWATVVAHRLSTDEQVDAVTSERPAERSGLETMAAQNTVALLSALRSTPPETQVWMWGADKSVGFIGRRQAHEALIHRVDAELTAGTRTPLNPTLAADGVHEALGVMYGGPPAWGTFTADPAHIVGFSTLDTDDHWTVVVGRFSGTGPDGREHDMRCLDWIGDDAKPTARVVGTAGDLDCWLWARDTFGEVSTTGNESTLVALHEAIDDGIQ